jgi:hypothetical protein
VRVRAVKQGRDQIVLVAKRLKRVSQLVRNHGATIGRRQKRKHHHQHFVAVTAVTIALQAVDEREPLELIQPGSSDATC